jgi:hypothetical protein
VTLWIALLLVAWFEGIQLHALLDEVRFRMGSPPRQLGLRVRLRLRAFAPWWLPSRDPLLGFYRNQSPLLRDGAVVWGAIIQANMLLFQQGAHSHPAEVIYSSDPFFDRSLHVLVDIARSLFLLKGTTPADLEKKPWAETLTDEMQRSMGRTVPKSLTDGRDVWGSTVMVIRAHVPGRRLQSSWLPLLRLDNCPFVMIVPSRYWPDELVNLWTT